MRCVEHSRECALITLSTTLALQSGAPALRAAGNHIDGQLPGRSENGVCEVSFPLIFCRAAKWHLKNLALEKQFTSIGSMELVARCSALRLKVHFPPFSTA